ncbi:MAG TPA: DUF1127 domain-containing protein [Beijerinckiaceae bacterium]|nr:DUF1127 domain-containing protein [Beijerinckiaceae bacterium]
MSNLSFSAPITAPAVFAVAKTTLVNAVAGLWQAWMHRRAVRQLQGFDARMLKDIGLGPTDVDAALSQPFTVDPSLHLSDVAAGRRPRRG